MKSANTHLPYQPWHPDTPGVSISTRTTLQLARILLAFASEMAAFSPTRVALAPRGARGDPPTRQPELFARHGPDLEGSIRRTTR